MTIYRLKKLGLFRVVMLYRGITIITQHTERRQAIIDALGYCETLKLKG